MTSRAVFPGSFDPFTVAHLAVAAAAHRQLGVDAVVASLSTVALAKDPRGQTPVEDRAAAIASLAVERPWLDVQVTSAQLLADVADGYDWLVLGADKWTQLHDVSFYGGDAQVRDRAIERLPPVAFAPRAGGGPPPSGVTVLDLPARFATVSATAVRGGRHDWRA